MPWVATVASLTSCTTRCPGPLRGVLAGFDDNPDPRVPAAGAPGRGHAGERVSWGYGRQDRPSARAHWGHWPHPLRASSSRAASSCWDAGACDGRPL